MVDVLLVVVSLISFGSEVAESVEERLGELADPVWLAVADCESGDWWDGVPEPGSRRWDYGESFSHGDIFQGGLNFHPGTWDAFRDSWDAEDAWDAPWWRQVIVGERVLAAQGWGAWPVCSRMLGLR